MKSLTFHVPILTKLQTHKRNLVQISCATEFYPNGKINVEGTSKLSAVFTASFLTKLPVIQNSFGNNQAKKLRKYKQNFIYVRYVNYAFRPAVFNETHNCLTTLHGDHLPNFTQIGRRG